MCSPELRSRGAEVVAGGQVGDGGRCAVGPEEGGEVAAAGVLEHGAARLVAGTDAEQRDDVAVPETRHDGRLTTERLPGDHTRTRTHGHARELAQRLQRPLRKLSVAL